MSDELAREVVELRAALAQVAAENAALGSRYESAVHGRSEFRKGLRAERKKVNQLRAALQGLLAEPYGCPRCDSGKLRDPAKDHIDECPYRNAADALRASGFDKTQEEPTDG